MMKKQLFQRLIALFLCSVLNVSMATETIPVNLQSQAISSDFWWAYLASYDQGPGSIVVNLGLKKQLPLSNYPILIITGVTYVTQRVDGLPESSDLDNLNKLSSKLIEAIEKVTPSIHAGTFKYNRECLHYIYVKDGSIIEEALKAFYLKECPGCKTYTNIKDDPDWTAYKDFLFPNQATLDFYHDDLAKLQYKFN